jgi:hypothetical protein
VAERAAHLVDHVFPEAPVRQWVLSLPHRLRYVLAWDHALCRAVAAVFVRAVLGSLRRRARRNGVPGGRGGAVAIIQRFGAALNLNVHVHALVLDGVYVDDGEGGLCFHAAAPPADEEMCRRLLGLAAPSADATTSVSAADHSGSGGSPHRHLVTPVSSLSGRTHDPDR